MGGNLTTDPKKGAREGVPDLKGAREEAPDLKDVDRALMYLRCLEPLGGFEALVYICQANFSVLGILILSIRESSGFSHR